MSPVLLMGVASLSTPRSCACKRCAQPRTVSMVSSTPESHRRGFVSILDNGTHYNTGEERFRYLFLRVQFSSSRFLH